MAAPPSSDPFGMIGHALHEARMRGFDTLSQFHHAVAKVRAVRPDLSRDATERLVYTVMWPPAEPGRGPPPAPGS